MKRDGERKLTDAAFPCGYIRPEYRGLTKRELFAAMAMQGIMSNPEAMKQAFVAGNVGEWLGVNAALAADALLKELNKEPAILERSEESSASEVTIFKKCRVPGCNKQAPKNGVKCKRHRARGE